MISPMADPVLLFDGECGLCQRVVRLLLRLDREGRLRFAPLQGPSAQAYLTQHGLPTRDFDTLVFVPAWSHRERADFLLRTDGVVAALRTTGGGGRFLAGVLRIIPHRFRDAAYRTVGHWRYRLFGPAKPRAMPFEWTARFLD